MEILELLNSKGKLVQSKLSEIFAYEKIDKLGKLSCDDFLGGKVKIYQPLKGFRAGFESVFLAASIAVKTGDKLLEAGSGVGTVCLCLAKRLDEEGILGVEIKGIEIDENQVELANINTVINECKSDVSFINADVTAASLELENKNIKPDSFSHVFANPPFFSDDAARLPKGKEKKLAYVQKVGDLERWLLFLVRVVKPSGNITLIQRVEALPQILRFLERRAGNIKIVPIYSNKDKEARTVLIQATKSSKSPFILKPSIILQKKNGKYKKLAQDVLRHGKRFDI